MGHVLMNFHAMPVVACVARGARFKSSSWKTIIFLHSNRDHAPPRATRRGSTSLPQGCGGSASRRRWFPGSHADPCYCRRGMNCCCAVGARTRTDLARIGEEGLDRSWLARQLGLCGAGQGEPDSISIFILPCYSISQIRYVAPSELYDNNTTLFTFLYDYS